MKGVMGTPEVMRSRFEAAKAVLASHPTVDAKRLGAVGFSMGGPIVLTMARMGDDLAGVVSVYGNLETKNPAKAGVTKSRVLVIHADGDPFVKPEAIPAFKKEMEAAKVNYSFVTYAGVKHGFANPEATVSGKKFDMPIAYNAEADRKAKAEVVKFFSGIFDKR
jgi:dienelactone hydrolase